MAETSHKQKRVANRFPFSWIISLVSKSILPAAKSSPEGALI
jgi:hypothetical protein